MSTKAAVIATVIVLVLAGALGCAGVFYISKHRIPDVSAQERGRRLGMGTGTLTGIVLCVIWGLWFYKRRQRQAGFGEEEDEDVDAQPRRPRRRRRPVEPDDEEDAIDDEEDRPRRPPPRRRRRQADEDEV